MSDERDTMKMLRGMMFLLAGLLVLPLVSAIGAAGPQANGPAVPIAEPLTVVRIYDVSDLVEHYPDWAMADTPRAAGFASGPATEPPFSPPTNNLLCGDTPSGRPNSGPTRDELAATLTHDIESTIAPESWHDNGGTLGTLIADCGNLIVSQSPATQKLVKDFLDQLSERNSQTIRVVADWVWLPAGDAAKLLKAGNEGPDAAMREIDSAALAALPASVRHVHAEISGRNGQMVYIASGRTRSLVTNVTPVVSTAVAAFAPTISSVAGGLGLQVKPMAKPDLGFAIIELYATFDDLGTTHEASAAAVAGIALDPPATTRPAAASPTSRPATPSSVLTPFNTIGMTVLDVRTTLRVPLGRPVLVAGGNWDAAAHAPAPGNGALQALLILTVHAMK